MKDRVIAGLAALIGVGLIFWAILGIGSMVEPMKCEQRWGEAYETKWSFMGGCKVKINGKWIPSGAIKEIIR